MKIILFLLVLCLTKVVHSFDYRKCRQFQVKHSSFIYGPTTSMQFTSSTGACSALASRSEEKKRFFVINYEKFQNDVVHGKGEYLLTFGQISNCSKNEQLRLNRFLKKNYSSIFSSVIQENSYDKVNVATLAICLES